MGHDDEPAGSRRPATLQVCGEPRDAFHVEVVSRLVEKQDVPVADQQGRERDPAALASAQLAEGGAPGDATHEPLDHVAYPGIARPLVFGAVPHDGVRNDEVVG